MFYSAVRRIVVSLPRNRLTEEERSQFIATLKKLI